MNRSIGRDGSPNRPNGGHGRDGSPSRPNDGRLGEASLPRASLPARKWLRHGTPDWVRNGVFFITINCQKRGSNQLCEAPTSSVIQESAAYYHAKRWWVHLWLVMPDHLHALLSFPESESIIRVVGDWKRYVARRTGVAWQKGFFDHRLRGDESFEEKAHYIRMNPLRAGLVNTMEEWSFVFTSQDLDGRDGSPSRPNDGRGRDGSPSRPNGGRGRDGSPNRPNDGRLGEASLPKGNQP